MRRLWLVTAMLVGAVVLPSGAAYACGFLVAENGAIRLDTFTAASILTEDGDAHYVTSFSFNGSPESFGAVIPLPDIPVEVEKAPGWFLQRLGIETTPRDRFAGAEVALSADSYGAEVIASYEVDALDITVLRGGGADVLEWASDNGFDLGVGDGDPDDLSDAVSMLDFYAERSPIFAAIKFDNRRAAEQELNSGEGIPVRFSFADQDQAWIPVKILTFDKPDSEIVVADLFLMTPDTPKILGGLVAGTDVTFQQSYGPNSLLVADLTDDERAEWVPTRFTLTRIDVRSEARLLDWDIAARTGGTPEPVWAFGTSFIAARNGETYAGSAPFSPDPDIVRSELTDDGPPWLGIIAAALVVAVPGFALYRRRRQVSPRRPV
ncbi:MAG: hypothetical protein ACRDUY_14470 [Nitriliruptorales bacterium]